MKTVLHRSKQPAFNHRKQCSQDFYLSVWLHSYAPNHFAIWHLNLRKHVKLIFFVIFHCICLEERSHMVPSWVLHMLYLAGSLPPSQFIHLPGPEDIWVVTPETMYSVFQIIFKVLSHIVFATQNKTKY